MIVCDLCYRNISSYSSVENIDQHNMLVDLYHFRGSNYLLIAIGKAPKLSSTTNLHYIYLSILLHEHGFLVNYRQISNFISSCIHFSLPEEKKNIYITICTVFSSTELTWVNLDFSVVETCWKGSPMESSCFP